MVSSRRGFLAFSAAAVSGGHVAARDLLSVHTFGDSILDCGHYNAHGVHPGQLLVQNDDRLFPDFRGQDLRSRQGGQLDHRAVDGATVEGLQRQLAGLRAPSVPAVALLTVGGNDLLRGLAADQGAGLREFQRKLDAFVRALPIRPLLVGTVYDPTFGDDSRNFLGLEAKLARRNLQRVNDVLASVAARHGALADLHAHFLRGDPSWFTHTIEPSLRGASEVRRAFLPLVLKQG
ncbi:MAG: GDSL-like lipase/acylhydrolase [Ramlibacter sp.]|jgi:lysophospholipase L1-like esterase|nr:GDSL-like lipase/acylhydrolase [Ramlibacter sp.]